MGYDINPENDSIIKQDFYELSLPYDKKNIVIGNPPFGYKAKIAIDFINKSLKFSDIVIFILPIQFRRYLTQKQISKNAKLIFSSPELKRDSFIYKGNPYHVNCIFQIWTNNVDKFNSFENLRLTKPLENTHPDFETWIHNNTKNTLKYFDKNKYEWDFAIVRQGFYDYSEKIIDQKKLKKNRQYVFIKINNPRAQAIFQTIDFKKLSKSNTSVPGFSNTDLVKEYNKKMTRGVL